MKSDSMMTPDDVAGRLKISKATVLRLAKAGQLRALRVGKKTVRFDPAEVARFVEAGGRA